MNVSNILTIFLVQIDDECYCYPCVDPFLGCVQSMNPRSELTMITLLFTLLLVTLVRITCESELSVSCILSMATLSLVCLEMVTCKLSMISCDQSGKTMLYWNLLCIIRNNTKLRSGIEIKSNRKLRSENTKLRSGIESKNLKLKSAIKLDHSSFVDMNNSGKVSGDIKSGPFLSFICHHELSFMSSVFNMNFHLYYQNIIMNCNQTSANCHHAVLCPCCHGH